MSFTVPSKYRPRNIVLVHQVFEGVDCLTLGVVRSVEAVCLEEDNVNYSYTIDLGTEKNVSVPEDMVV